MIDTNIGYWEKVLQNPTPEFKALIDSEREYLLENVPDNSTVLDIGCGDGRNIETLLTRTDKISGVDNDGFAVTEASKKFPNTKVRISKNEAEKLSFDDCIFDVVVCFDLLQNLDDKKVEVLKEIKRVLRDSGKLLLCAYSETAFEDRVRMYKIIGVPIERTEGTKVYFDKSVGSNISEQFSLDEIKSLAGEAGLHVTDWQKIGNLAYLMTLSR